MSSPTACPLRARAHSCHEGGLRVPVSRRGASHGPRAANRRDHRPRDRPRRAGHHHGEKVEEVVTTTVVEEHTESHMYDDGMPGFQMIPGGQPLGMPYQAPPPYGMPMGPPGMMGPPGGMMGPPMGHPGGMMGPPGGMMQPGMQPGMPHY